MKKTNLRKALALTVACVMLFASFAFAGDVAIDTSIPMLDSDLLSSAWKADQTFTLADPAPWNLSELKQVVDVTDPRSVAAYWVWAVSRLTDNYDDGMAMMKYLFADLEPYGRGFTEGGASGRAGWDTYFNERLKDNDYKWLPRAYFAGASDENAFTPNSPREIDLYYNNTNTETLNAQSLEQLGRLNIVYWVKSNAAGNQVNITLSKFEGSDRWYVTSGTSSTALFYDQRGGVSSATREKLKTTPNDTSTAEEHNAKYGTGKSADETEDTASNPEEKTVIAPAPEETEDIAPAPEGEPGIAPAPAADDEFDCKGNSTCPQFTVFFDDALPYDHWAHKGIDWAIINKITNGIDASHFGPYKSCTRGQVVTFLWRAAGEPEPANSNNPFKDVKSSDYYYKPILWAVEKGITAGTSATTFSPNQTCSSAHIITFLFRANGIGKDGWYEEARSWAVSNGLLADTGLTVKPEELCPRCAVVTFLFRSFK